MFKLRYFQQDAFDISMDFIKKSYDPFLLELATGAGKSLIVAEIAKALKNLSGKKVLCLAPSKELIEQNRSKYLSYGEPASMFSASTGSKCLAHDVVFGSPVTVLNSINSFGDNISGVIIDEAHGITPTIKKIIYALKELNPLLRVIGLTATPYRMNTGYIYRVDEKSSPVPEDETKDPFFHKLLYKVQAQTLIDDGYLTPPIADIMEGYETSELELKGGKYTQDSIAEVFEGQGRKTAEIVRQVVECSINRKGVMFFASTIQHAQEVMESLPPENSKLITGDTPKKDRELIIEQFKAVTFKYLVNVSVLTTGFDAPHVDVVAVLRATESPNLFQQIIGRGLRLIDPSTAGDINAIARSKKPNCLVLDFAENIERHGLEDDLFNPDIKVNISSGEKFHIKAQCPLCSITNTFSGRPNKEDFEVDNNGYFVDLAGDHIIENEQPLPAHFGRRCNGFELIKGKHEQCNYRWSHKICTNDECSQENDIAARYCKFCKEELVDPNEKLKIDFKRMKISAREISTDKVKAWFAQSWISQKGNESLRVDYTTDYRTFSFWYSPESRTSEGQAIWNDLCLAVFGRACPSIDLFIKALQKGVGLMPVTVTCQKKGDFFKVYAHNKPEDILDEIS